MKAGNENYWEWMFVNMKIDGKLDKTDWNWTLLFRFKWFVMWLFVLFSTEMVGYVNICAVFN